MYIIYDGFLDQKFKLGIILIFHNECRNNDIFAFII